MESPEEVVQVFVVLKYVSAASFMVVVFDHFITLDDEINTIWTNPSVRLHSKAAFVVNRYLTEAISAYVVYIFSGMGTTLSTAVCRRFIWIYGITCIVAGAISHFVILIRVYALWDRRTTVSRILMAAFTICISTTTILGIFAAIQMHRKYSLLTAQSSADSCTCIVAQLTYFEPLHTCVFGTKPKAITAMLGVLSLFDFFLVMLIIFNAMDRPRLTHIEIVSGLQKDGVGFFLAIFALRFADLIISIFQSPAEVFVTITTVWGFCTILNARLHMRLEGLSLATSQGRLIMLEDM
ncbi:hypothetical protein B0H10DRAFT_2191826 [Mycena sp. CBHHK59/15]|nr:hypothetical protein B0H10DRAFT_2191826 [Mycena sp. CBHHK59/15]